MARHATWPQTPLPFPKRAARPHAPATHEPSMFEALEQRMLLSAIPDITGAWVDGKSVTTYAEVELELGQSFRFQFEVANVGQDDSPSPYNNMTVSFPQFTSSSDKGRVSLYSKSSDLDYNEYWGSVPGGDKWAEYVMVESVDTDGWDGKDFIF